MAQKWADPPRKRRKRAERKSNGIQAPATKGQEDWSAKGLSFWCQKQGSQGAGNQAHCCPLQGWQTH
tara:strand:- start:805 stop:1005 length:201 start_codon:yes stop_codon:yes gene_type:complete